MKKLSIYLPVLLVIVSLGCLCMAKAKNQPGLSLKETFDVYIQSVQNSDLDGLFSTVTEKEHFFFLTSTGKLINTREGYYEFHEDWFKEKEWEMPVDLIEIHEGKEYGYTSAIFNYKSKSPEGRTYFLDSYFTLIFHKENGMWKVVADVCTPISQYFKEDNPDIRYTSEQIYLLNIIKNRRTVRKFKPTPVPKEHILKILDAAHYAPTSGNQQPWKFLVIQDRRKLNQLREKALEWYLERYKKLRNPNPEELTKAKAGLKDILENVLSAPVYVAVLVDSKAQYPDFILYDGTLATGYLMIAARALGYGTGFFTTFFPDDKMRQFFNIPNNYRLICFTPIGVPEKWPETPPKKSLEDLVIFEEF